MSCIVNASIAMYSKMCQLLKETPVFFNVSEVSEFFKQILIFKIFRCWKLAGKSSWGFLESYFSAF